MALKRLTRHLGSTGETYIQHASAALGIARRCFKAGVYATVHGAVPFLFEDSASKEIDQINRVITKRRGKRKAKTKTRRPRKKRAA